MKSKVLHEFLEKHSEVIPVMIIRIRQNKH